MRSHPVKKRRRRRKKKRKVKKKKRKVKKKKRKVKKKTVKRSPHTRMMSQPLMMWRSHKLSNQYSRLLLSSQSYHLWMIIHLLKNQLVSSNLDYRV